jgi:hypothetical protein
LVTHVLLSALQADGSSIPPFATNEQLLTKGTQLWAIIHVLLSALQADGSSILPFATDEQLLTKGTQLWTITQGLLSALLADGSSILPFAKINNSLRRIFSCGRQHKALIRLAGGREFDPALRNRSTTPYEGYSVLGHSTWAHMGLEGGGEFDPSWVTDEKPLAIAFGFLIAQRSLLPAIEHP